MKMEMPASSNGSEMKESAVGTAKEQAEQFFDENDGADANATMHEMPAKKAGSSG